MRTAVTDKKNMQNNSLAEFYCYEDFCKNEKIKRIHRYIVGKKGINCSLEEMLDKFEFKTADDLQQFLIEEIIFGEVKLALRKEISAFFVKREWLEIFIQAYAFITKKNTRKSFIRDNGIDNERLILLQEIIRKTSYLSSLERKIKSERIDNLFNFVITRQEDSVLEKEICDCQDFGSLGFVEEIICNDLFVFCTMYKKRAKILDFFATRSKLNVFILCKKFINRDIDEKSFMKKYKIDSEKLELIKKIINQCPYLANIYKNVIEDNKANALYLYVLELKSMNKSLDTREILFKFEFTNQNLLEGFITHNLFKPEVSKKIRETIIDFFAEKSRVGIFFVIRGLIRSMNDREAYRKSFKIDKEKLKLCERIISSSPYLLAMQKSVQDKREKEAKASCPSMQRVARSHKYRYGIPIL